MIRLHNTLSGKIEEFKPISDNVVTLYTCGPTVYDYLHVGNWSAYIYWDILVRTLIANNLKVKRTLNITDVGHLTSDADEGEDKLEKGAKREGKNAWDIANFYTQDFINGMSMLNLLAPETIAKATDYIDEQLDLLKLLYEKGYTYQIDDGIYFDTSKFPRYSDFAHLELTKQETSDRIIKNPQKRNESDFALWKFSPSELKRDMEWQTPQDILEKEELKMGFPGWHLECSAIIKATLGLTIDIHTGGIDHIPVHHTNEIAQSEAANNAKLANYWLHNNHMKIEGGKISKSLGNGYTLRDVTERGFVPIDLKMLVLQGHYRSEGNFSFDGLEAAANRRKHWLNIAALRHQIGEANPSDSNTEVNSGLYKLGETIKELCGEDLGTPAALASVDNIFGLIDNIDDVKKINRNALVSAIESIDELLGLNIVNDSPDINDVIKRIIAEREGHRANQEWNSADKLRDELLQKGIELRDLNGQTIWQYK